MRAIAPASSGLTGRNVISLEMAPWGPRCAVVVIMPAMVPAAAGRRRSPGDGCPAHPEPPVIGGFSAPRGEGSVPAMGAPLRAGEDTLDAISRLADGTLSSQELIERVAERVDRVVPTDGYFLAATDPETTLSLGMGVVSELPADFLKYADIARSGPAVADMNCENSLFIRFPCKTKHCPVHSMHRGPLR